MARSGPAICAVTDPPEVDHQAARARRVLAGSWAPPLVLRHGDDDLAACVPLLHAAQALGRAGQRVRPVQDRCELPGLDEPGEGEQLLPLLFVRDQPEPLSDEIIDDDRPQDASDGARTRGRVSRRRLCRYCAVSCIRYRGHGSWLDGTAWFLWQIPR